MRLRPPSLLTDSKVACLRTQKASQKLGMDFSG